MIENWLRDLSRDEVVSRLNRKKVPCEAISEFDEVLKQPQLQWREMIQEVVHPIAGGMGLKVAGFPIKFSRLKSDLKTPAPYPGEHSKAVYKELLGISEETIDRLKQDGVI